MIIAPHWKLREYMHELRGDKDNPRTRHDARLAVLLTLMLHANTRLRCWPSTKTLCKETGFNTPSVTEARDWLLEHKAIKLVPYDKREGKEKDLPQRQFVYQLTGVIEVSTGLEPYIAMTDEIEQMAKSEGVETSEVSQRETLNDIEVSQRKVSQTKTFVSETKGSSSSKGSTKDQKHCADAPNGDQHRADDEPAHVFSRSKALC